MNLSVVIQQIRTLVPVFGDRVGGAVDYFRARDQGFLDPPAAYVVPLNDVAEPFRDETDYHQSFTERIAVIVVVANADAVAAGDRRAQTAAGQFDALKWALFKALLKWRPNSVGENSAITATTPGADHSGRGLYYVGAAPLEPSLALSFFQFEFALDVEITTDDVWQPEAGPLEGVDIFVIDPFRVEEPVGEPLRTVVAGELIDLQAGGRK